MTIKIEISGDTGQEVREKMRSLLGGMTVTYKVADGAAVDETKSDLKTASELAEDASWTQTFRETEKFSETETVSSSSVNVNPEDDIQVSDTKDEAPAPFRKHGEPSAGNKRRNSAEKAEDDLIEDLAVKAGLDVDNVVKIVNESQQREQAIADLKKRVEQKAAEPDEKPAISTGEERVGPEDEPAETQEQDAADEAAEEESKAGATQDDVRKAMGAYSTKYGIECAVEDGKKINESVLGPVPDDLKRPNGDKAVMWFLSAFPADRYADLVEAWNDALETNPYKREVKK